MMTLEGQSQEISLNMEGLLLEVVLYFCPWNMQEDNI